MKLTNETNDDPIYEAENGDPGGGPFPKHCRIKPHGPPRECKNGTKALGYSGRFTNRGEVHDFPKLKGKKNILRFYPSEDDTGNNWCQRFDDLDAAKEYKLEGNGCGNYTLSEI